MRGRLFKIQDETNGMHIPRHREAGGQQNLRNPEKSNAAGFPDEIKSVPVKNNPGCK